MLRNLLPLLLLALASAGCQREQEAAPEAAAPGESTGPIADFGGERVWQGVLPCSDCLGIDTRLVLRQQGNQQRYHLEETYLGAPEPNHFERKGRWVQRRAGGDDETLYVLDPESAPRRFVVRSDGGIELVTGEPGAPPAPEFRLQRL